MMSAVWWASCALLPVLAAALVQAQPEQAPPQPFTAGAKLVVVPAAVVDGRGRPVLGLTLNDFEVREDGAAVSVTTFVAAHDDTTASGATGADAADGRFMVLLLDNMSVPPTVSWRVKDIAQRFVTRMGRRDVLTVIRLNGDNSATSSDKPTLLAAIDQYVSTGSIEENELDARHAMETISQLSQQLAASTQGARLHRHRRLFSPERPPDLIRQRNAQPAAVPAFSRWWFDAIKDTSRRNVSVYVIDPAGAAGPSGPFADYDAAGSFAAETGGDAFVRTSNFAGVVNRIWQESGSFYLLGYQPPIDDGRLHRIEVKVKRSGAQVHARRGRGSPSCVEHAEDAET